MRSFLIFLAVIAGLLLIVVATSGAVSAQTPLVDAITDGDGDRVAALLADGADPNAAAADGVPPLFAAVEQGRPDLARLLLDAGADPDRGPASAETPLGRAAASNAPDLIAVLLAGGAYVNAPDDEALRTPLHHAALWSATEALAALLAAEADPTTADLDGATPLHLAVDGSPLGVEILLDGGADPTARDADGDTPLHRAARGAHLDTVQLLAQQGVDLDAAGQGGMTPLMAAAAWSDDDADLVRALLDAGADLAAAAEDGRTALHVAAAFDAPRIARVLLDAGAEVDATPPGAFGGTAATPLFWAFNGSLDASVAPLLLEAGADPLADSPVGISAIAAAARDDHLDVVLPYLTAHPEALDPVMVPLAAARGDADGVRALLALGAPTDAETPGGSSAVFAAAVPPDPYLLERLGEAYDPAGSLAALLDAGADPDGQGNDGNLWGTALHAAAWHGRAELAALLLDADADAARTAELGPDAVDALGLARRRLADEDGYGTAPSEADLRAVIALLE